MQIKVTVLFLSSTIIDRMEPAGEMQTGQKTLVILNQGTLVSNLKNMFSSENNFSDLKLKSKDNMIINAHKLILAGLFITEILYSVFVSCN